MNAPFPRRQRPISIAILAMGGEGGGVLADWIVDLAESNHYIAQLTSVPGVAQRTGATIYYLEIYPRAGVIDAAHEPVLGVAELKIRASRFERVREEVRANDDQILEIAEFMHPRTQEIADTLPAPLGRFILGNGWVRGLIDRMTRKGRVVKTSSLRGFLLLYIVASLKPLRPRSLRYQIEQVHLEEWLATVLRIAAIDYDLAVEVAAARNLVKGYGDTHERGRAHFDTLIGLLPALSRRADGAAQFAALRKAANADDTGAALNAAIEKMKEHSLPLIPA